MEQKTDQQRVLLFCEECGEKNFISLDQADKKGQEIKFRCPSCDYLNTVSTPILTSKSS